LPSKNCTSKPKSNAQTHLDITESAECAGDIEFANQADWDAWFASYTDFILRYARLAQEQNVSCFAWHRVEQCYA